MYVHENVVRIWGGWYKSLYTPRVYAPGLRFRDARHSVQGSVVLQ